MRHVKRKELEFREQSTPSSWYRESARASSRNRSAASPLGTIARALASCNNRRVNDSPDSWATLEIKVSSNTAELSEEVLDAFSYYLAELEGVGGVETRDGGPELLNPLSVADPDAAPTPGDPTRCDIESWFGENPGVVIYTTPPFLESLQEQAHRLGESMQLQLVARHQERNDDSWRDTWKKFYQPIEIGQRLRICPSWEQDKTSKVEHTLVLDPGRAFGTGLHESTRLCLQAIAAWSAPPPQARVLDLGCGSGILGLSAATLWDASLQEMTFADLDPDAVQTAQENADLNTPWETRLHFESGTAESLSLAEPVDWLFANIRPEVLLPDASAICARLAPGGQLLLSGILDEEKDEVLARYTQEGLTCIAQEHLRGWTALTMRKAP